MVSRATQYTHYMMVCLSKNLKELRYANLKKKFTLNDDEHGKFSFYKALKIHNYNNMELVSICDSNDKISLNKK